MGSSPLFVQQQHQISHRWFAYLESSAAITPLDGLTPSTNRSNFVLGTYEILNISFFLNSLLNFNSFLDPTLNLLDKYLLISRSDLILLLLGKSTGGN